MFLRVDDRLIHGQVVTAWMRELNVKVIMVIDDLAASNPVIRQALKMATPGSIKLVVKKVADGIHSVKDYNENDLLIICKTPITAKKVIDGNMNFHWNLNIGNIGMAPGRKTFAQTVHLDKNNYEACKTLDEYSNVHCFMQTVPGQAIKTL
ncbi:PTS sugar transporter subunit IIB [Sporolactobacillus sp. CQH2019]|uniref:PTS sugar transporter subunit IIB n=1 Tax=Sporolactobacillus sp. CQH2019 TaxID=3023512 RepID=UPI002367807D|nr:PTS sugar transporter subunit IIB [Sporolactobacillus sp. CQH2019]MDD9150279.1 PTS sugar transporter subunit IIB [Sporolactobacillus sp. CQH2019]